ncbi:MAG: hypothetical protein K8F30_03940, partial [Taibaiella sp.]|nr:hypothetical protein [Taibaiella sp.]
IRGHLIIYTFILAFLVGGVTLHISNRSSSLVNGPQPDFQYSSFDSVTDAQLVAMYNENGRRQLKVRNRRLIILEVLSRRGKLPERYRAAYEEANRVGLLPIAQVESNHISGPQPDFLDSRTDARLVAKYNANGRILMKIRTYRLNILVELSRRGKLPEKYRAAYDDADLLGILPVAPIEMN